MFDEAALDIETELVKTSRNGLIYIAEKKYGRIEDKMDHLACFAGKQSIIITLVKAPYDSVLYFF